MKPTISIIITTYNWPEALEHTLTALNFQNTDDFEVIVADDGSTEQTAQLIANFTKKTRYSLKHAWHADRGFRAAMIRNKAAAIASGNYLIFLDGDCIPQPTFVARHKRLAEKSWFVAGNRILLNNEFTKKMIDEPINLSQKSFLDWCRYRSMGYCNRLLPLLYVPCKGLRKQFKRQWKSAKTCNLAIWKEDFLRVNGFDESYQGWGYEDSDLVIRLIHAGIYRKSGRFAVAVFHLWHHENDRSHHQENFNRLEQTINSDNVEAPLGVSQYIALE